MIKQKPLGRFFKAFLPLFLSLSALVDAVPAAAAPPGTGPEFGYNTVQELAAALAKQSFIAPDPGEGKYLEKLNYSYYQMLRFRKEHALWRDDSPFRVEFFHQGSLFTNPVIIYEVDKGAVREILFSSSFFNISPPASEMVKPGRNYKYSGFKVFYPLRSAAIHDEVIVFLGASYFRTVALGLNYGISARGLAVDTAEARGEEFPRFSRFWLVKPAPGDAMVVVYALLESPSLTGAYRFVVTPGLKTIVECTASLYLRDRDHKLGIAPLTSMFLRGENTGSAKDDFRPEIHDSDGLLMITGSGSEYIWRPLQNRSRAVQTSRFVDFSPKGFGLIQRDREFEQYLDLEAHYHRRPSMWIEPLDSWGPGSVELVEIPVNGETNDNIAAYWVPKSIESDELTFRYRVITDAGGPQVPFAHTVRTVSHPIDLPEDRAEKRVARRFLLDFAGDELGLLAEDQPVAPVIAISNGSFSEVVSVKNPDRNEWRIGFIAERDREATADMKVFLTLYGRRMSETWTYLWRWNE